MNAKEIARLRGIQPIQLLPKWNMLANATHKQRMASYAAMFTKEANRFRKTRQPHWPNGELY